jgi:hypothetical protein
MLERRRGGRVAMVLLCQRPNEFVNSEFLSDRLPELIAGLLRPWAEHMHPFLSPKPREL